MSRKHNVAMPLIMIASWALSPMINGNTNVAPNMATTCWAPRPTVLPHDSLLSGATMSFGPSVPSCSFQPIDIFSSKGSRLVGDVGHALSRDEP
jgi:hypothetical protein